MTDLLHRPGFLGTSANFAADLTLILSLLVIGIFTAGFAAARQGNYRLHGRIQTTGALLNLGLVLWMMLLPYRDFILRDLAEPRPRPAYFYTLTTLHALAGAAALLFGFFVVLRGHNLMISRLKFNNYRPYMRLAFALYLAATALGVGVYLVWFVLIANPPLFQ